MKLEATFLHSKVARRIFLLFILCALLPLTALAILSFSQVTKQLNQQSQSRLGQATKAVGMAIYERLMVLEGEMKLIAAHTVAGSVATVRAPSKGSDENLTPRFTGLALITDRGGHVPRFGRIQDAPELTAPEKDYVNSGKTLVSSQSYPDRPARIFMSRALDPHDPRRGILVGEIDTTYLWDIGDESALPAMTELCVLDQSNHPLFCSPDLPASFPEDAARRIAGSAVGRFEWRQPEKEYLASFWSLFLQPRFRVPRWTVVLSESKADVLAPMADFKKTFSLVILMALWVVLLLSISQIRRSLIPLEKLREGTRRLARRDFDSRVTVTSGDEFEEVAASFNMMASRLGRQFHALSTMAEIDQGILAALDTRKIVDTLITRMRDVFPCESVGVTLVDSNAPDLARTHTGAVNPEGETLIEAVQLLPEEMQMLRGHPESLLISDGEVPHYLGPLARRGLKSFLVLPIFLKERLSGIISLGCLAPPAYDQEDLIQARQLADQAAVALSNARLVEELDQLNWGTLTALARTIDANSSWTAGHSERVTTLALKIGQVLGLIPKQLEVLHRAGLLHDIGKIGTPAAILDKQGGLTDEESLLMHAHVLIGGRILEPIAAYAEVIPIVLQHHEWFDGTGYPNGLSGDAISLGARILAVADSFDAMISGRPYRPARDPERVVELIRQGAGGQFDPEVVQAFVEVVAQRETRGHPDRPSHPRLRSVPPGDRILAEETGGR